MLCPVALVQVCYCILGSSNAALVLPACRIDSLGALPAPESRVFPSDRRLDMMQISIRLEAALQVTSLECPVVACLYRGQ
jgi:hypothetical protein